MLQPGFVHLRVHTEYSIGDSTVRVDSLVEAAVADAQPAVAITDLVNLFGWIKFYKAARGKGLKPILGADCWLANDADRDRPSRLLLLARNPQGYLRLCDLISRAWLENEYRGRAELSAAWFDEGANDGLILLSGARHGDVGQALLAGQADAAAELASAWAARFPGSYYLEVQRAGTPEDENQTRAAARLARRLGLPVVATHPVQFIEREGFRAHEARVCIAEGEILANPRRPRRFTEEQYFRTQAEMQALFADLPSALANSVEIARRCSLPMTLGKPRLPQFPTPEGITLDDYMRQLAREGLRSRMIKLFPSPAELEAKREQYERRLDYECDTIVQMGFSGYFLIVADFINWAKANGVPVGPGRGSGAGSLVAYVLGITDLDPIPYALLFERFLNPERVSMPDFDIDFCQENRWKVIEYVRRKYGEQAVSQIATFGTMASKAVIRDAGRVLDMGYNFCDQLSKLIPVVQNKPVSLAKAREAEPLLREREEREDEVRELLALAEPLEDLTRNVGMHAGGVLIAPGRLTDFCPLYKAPGTDSVVSQFDKDDVEAVGLVKFDFLGLRNLTILQMAVDYINARHPEKPLDLTTLEFTDPKAYQVLKDANTTAIFQVESDGMKKLLKKLQPDRFEDIIAALALYRPGPLGSGMVDDFILRKKGEQKIDYFHPDLKACLEPTYGVIVYQEQVMQIAQIIGGYTLGGADLLRRAMGKKKPEEMAEHRGLFVEGAQKKGYDTDLANRLFDLMAMFAEYGFNKSHTAAYAVVTYHTAWLKAYYPSEFIAATLSSEMDDTDKLQFFVADAKANGVQVLPPDINASGYRFQPVSDRAIRYGLGAVKGSGESAVMNILKAREQGPYRDLYEFCTRIDRKIVNRRTLEALARAGAFDSLEPDRARVLANVGKAMEAAEAAAAAADQVSLFDAGDVEGGAPIEWENVAPWSERQRLQEEKAALGFFLTGHLFQGFEAEVRRFARTKLADLQPAQQPQWIAGIVASQRTQMSRRGKMSIVMLDDGSGAVELTLYNETFERYRTLIRDDELLVIQAKVSRDDYSGGQRVVAERVLGLTEARQEFGKRLLIRLNGLAEAGLLRNVIQRYVPGGADDGSAMPVVVEYGNADARCAVELGADWRVRPQEDLIVEARSRLHAQDVAVEY
ncbi:MAG TPA: DNA polymerase III subunit alpha [Quisquiliibacterium sp.]|nr:DNA polymerase III subunit alpha [Quisquiliibacterium sp.]